VTVRLQSGRGVVRAGREIMNEMLRRRLLASPYA